MLEVQNLGVNYQGIPILEDITLKLASRELVGLIGPNGAGKSTLIKAILGLVDISCGQVQFQGQPLRHQRRRLAYVPQRSQIDWNYPITAWNVVMLGRIPALGWLRCPTCQTKKLVQAALEQVQMIPYAHRKIGELSGGQQQRIFLARALVQNADLFLLDEPFTAIDQKTEAILTEVFRTLKQQGKTLLVCTHDWGESLKRYDRLLLLNRVLLADDEPEAVITLENVQQAYGEGFRPSIGGHCTLC